MLSDKSGLLSFNYVENSPSGSVSDVHKYTPGNNYIIRGKLSLTENQVQSVYENALTKTEESLTLKQTDDNKILGDRYIERLSAAATKFNESGKYTKINRDFFKPTVIKYSDIPNKTNNKNTLEKEKNSLEKNRGFSSFGKPDEINILLPIKADEIPNELKSIEYFPDFESKDLIYFYFHDIANKIYLPFRATIDSISDNNAVEWEDFQYIGRADHLYVYRGFTRDINFNFTVYANSVFELQPMWQRINYLTGLTRPSKYTTSPLIPRGEFIVPPLVKLRIGDLYVDLPIVIRSVGLTIPETATWELTRVPNKLRLYKYGEKILTNEGAGTAQLPMLVQIQINAAVLEKERSEGGPGPNEGATDPNKTRFFGNDLAFFKKQETQLPSTPIPPPAWSPSREPFIDPRFSL
jgi:hypothetical protein